MGDSLECKGRLYRCIENQYVNKRGDYRFEIAMTLQKRKSCNGCRHCCFNNESLEEEIGCGNQITIRPRVVVGKLYRLEIQNIIKNFETGIPDDWDTVFQLVEEEQ